MNKRTAEYLKHQNDNQTLDLEHAMIEADVPVIGVSGRNAEKLADLSRYLDRPALRWGAPLPEADIMLIATSDDSIAEVAAALAASKSVMAHTAGAAAHTSERASDPERLLI